MSTDFDAFLASQKANDVSAVAKQVEAQHSKFTNTREVDERFWNPASCIDKDGNGNAIIRFLPPPDSAESPFVKLLRHNYQRVVDGKKRFYNELSRKTIGLEDPVYDYNGSIFNKYDGNKDEAKKHLIPRTERFIANIMVIQNKQAPEQEGKVFLWDFGGQINAKIEAKMFPKGGKAPMNPFNIFEGANLEVIIYKKQVGSNELPQYDNSEWEAPSPMGKDPLKVIKSIFPELHSLKEFLDPSNFKSYEDLEKQMNWVLGKSAQPTTEASSDAPTGRTAEAASQKSSAPKEEVADGIPDFGVPSKQEAPAEQPQSSKEDDDFFARFK